MKRLVALLLSGLAFAPLAYGTTGSVYNNLNGLTWPPQDPTVDATNFFNNNSFTVFGFDTFDFSNVENFTNRNQITIFPSVWFDTAPSVSGSRHPAKNFVNANNVNGSFNNTQISGNTFVRINATNIINRGTITSGSAGLVQAVGDTVDISRSSITLGTFGVGGSIQDDHWGFATNAIDPVFNLDPNSPVVPLHTSLFVDPFFGLVTNNFFTFPFPDGVLTNGVPPAGLTSAYKQFQAGPIKTNTSLTIVFVRTADTNINVNITFLNATNTRLGEVFVEWSITSTNVLGQQVGNFLTLHDTYGSVTTNLFVTNTATGTLRPANFTLSMSSSTQAQGTNGVPYTSAFPPDTFGTNMLVPDVISNRVAGYGATILNTVADPADGSPELSFADRVRSLPGRVELNAGKFLNMNLARVQSSSYVLISSTNHFGGSTNAAVSTPFADLRLGSTNGALVATSVIQSNVRRISGSIDVYSGVWSNPITVQVTNTGAGLFNVIYVDAELTSQTASTLLDLDLRSHNGTNTANKGSVTIGDNFTVTGQFFVDASALTVANNGSVVLSPMNSDSDHWSDNAPSLKFFTNNGTISGSLGFNFLGAGQAPDGSDLPYTNFVNTGTIFNTANVIEADLVQNNGFIMSGSIFQLNSGGIFIQAGTVNVQTNGFFFSAGADIGITCLNLNVDGHVNVLSLPAFAAGRSLSLIISNSLSAGSNFWTVGDGFNLYVKPTTGDFNLVTVTNTAVAFENVFNTWAGEDRGPGAAGFTDNAAVGRLILDGASGSAFTFADLQDGDSITNALYVDVLVLRNNATNLDAGGNLANIFVQPEMKLYYSQVFFDTTDVTAGLSTKTAGGGGGFTQVTHAGAINTASVPGTGGGGGGVIQGDVGLKVTSDGTTVTVTWNTVAGATNYLYYKSAATGGTWQLLTSFKSGASGPTSVQDTPGPDTRVYKVRVDLPTQ